jgi:hypothetical protein
VAVSTFCTGLDAGTTRTAAGECRRDEKREQHGRGDTSVGIHATDTSDDYRAGNRGT